MKEKQSFEQVWSENYARVFRLCYSILRDLDVAEDATEDTFVKALVAYESFNPNRAQVFTWLYRIATNCALSILTARHRDNQNKTSLSATPALFPDDKTGEVDIEDITAHVPAAVERALFWEVFWESLSQLPDKEHIVIILRLIEELPRREIAEILGISVDAVFQAQMRGGKKLRALLRAQGFDPDEEC